MKIKRKSPLFIVFAAALMALMTLTALVVPALAQETGGEPEEVQEAPAPPTPAPTEGEEDSTVFYPAFRNIDVVRLNENQMALLMINNQIEYLMLQIREKENQLIDKDRQIMNLNAGFEERLGEVRREQAGLQAEHAAKLGEMEEKLAGKEADLEAGRQELHDLEKRVAAFLGDSGVYLVALLAALAGLVLGLILSSILSWRRNRPGSEPKSA